MPCQRCDSERVLYASAHCSDCFQVRGAIHEYTGYVPDDLGIGGGDNMTIEYCLDCGQIQGEFPISEPEFITKDHECNTCHIADEGVKEQYDGGLGCGYHHDECFSNMVSECRQRSW